MPYDERWRSRYDDWKTDPGPMESVEDKDEPEPDEWDELYERQAARDRLDGFERTNGRDWT